LITFLVARKSGKITQCASVGIFCYGEWKHCQSRRRNRIVAMKEKGVFRLYRFEYSSFCGECSHWGEYRNSIFGLLGWVFLYAVLQMGKEKKGWAQLE